MIHKIYKVDEYYVYVCETGGTWGHSLTELFNMKTGQIYKDRLLNYKPKSDDILLCKISDEEITYDKMCQACPELFI